MLQAVLDQISQGKIPSDREVLVAILEELVLINKVLNKFKIK